jgi:Bifunctional DNA primase/polymerase, N-terminal
VPIPEEIERIALLGWRVYPSSQYSRAACFKDATEAASCDLDWIDRQAREYPGCNWRMVFQGSRVWAFDLDVPSADHAHDGIAAMAALVQVHGPLPPRPMTRSGGGGAAIFFDWSGERIVGDTNKPYPGMDPRRGRQSLTVPPSIHLTTKRPYFWVTPPWRVCPPKAPAWLLKLVEPAPEKSLGPASVLKEGSQKRNYAVAALHNATRRVATSNIGGRNNTLNKECWSVSKFLADGSLTESEIRDCMIAAARAADIPIREACLTIDSAIRSKRK